jgi:hypothetical protein
MAQTLAPFLPRVEQVLTQTTRRVLQGELVPASEKSVSLFEPDTHVQGVVTPYVEFLSNSHNIKGIWNCSLFQA